LHELREILPPTVFFFFGFNFVVLTTNLILADYLVAFGNVMLATAGALIVGKAVLVTNAMPFLRRYDRAPLIQPILIKTLVYWAIVFLARLLDALRAAPEASARRCSRLRQSHPDPGGHPDRRRRLARLPADTALDHELGGAGSGASSSRLSSRQRDSLIGAKITLIARFNSRVRRAPPQTGDRGFESISLQR
jgi:hypothetical protein